MFGRDSHISKLVCFKKNCYVAVDLNTEKHKHVYYDIHANYMQSGLRQQA